MATQKIQIKPVDKSGSKDFEAWCSIAPRETYERLVGDENLDKVWSIACFL